ncbi:MAG: PAS domain S-box protein, partial [Candidatus Atribacteria bacterium]
MKDEDKTKEELIKELKFLREEQKKGVFEDITEHKKAEQIIQKSEKIYRELINNMISGVAIYEAKNNGKDFIIKDFNPAVEKIDKVKKEDILDKSVLQVFPGVKNFGLFKVFKEVYKTGKPQHHPIFYYKDQRISGWRDNYLYKLPSGEIAAIYDDITERKQAEESLKKNMQLLNDTGKMAKVGGWELDLLTQEVSWTEEVYRIHGVDPGQQPPKLEEALNFYAPEYKPALEEALKKTAETGEPYDLEFLFIPSGSKDKIWVRSMGKAVYQDGKIVKLAGTFQDIDKQKRAEEKLLASESRYRRLVENANEVILVAQDGIIKFVNPIASELIGYSNQELLSRSFLEFIHPDDRNMVGERYLRRLRGDVSQPRYNFRLVTRDGSIKWVEIGAVLIDWEGRPATLNFLTDITKQKQVQKALQEAHDQLENKVAQRTEELQKANLRLQELDRLKTIFIASMSHELRTPLSLIIGFTDIILQEISGEINREQRRQFTLVKKNASHLLSLISDILDVNKIEAGKAEMIIEEFDLSALSCEVRDNFKVAADKKGLALSLESPPILLLESDRRRTRQILVNLLSNALK